MIRINDEIKKELSIIINTQLKDPRTKSMTSVTKVETTQDLKFCKAHISVIGNEDEKAAVLEGLKNASGFIRKQIASTINLRNTPEFTFLLDDSLEHAIKMSKLIEEANRGIVSEKTEPAE